MSITDRLNNFNERIKTEHDNKFEGVLFCKVAGVTFGNRQETIKKIDENTSLRLDRDRQNKFDFYAILVMACIEEKWEEVGFIPATQNRPIAEAMDSGVSMAANFWGKTGGGENNFVYGVTVTVKRA